MLTIDVPLFRPKTVKSRADPSAGPLAAMFVLSLIVSQDEQLQITLKIIICFGQTPEI
jgi:hypothetical protein